MNFDSDQAAITPVSQSYLKIDTTGALWLPTGNNAERPGSPSAGFFRYNTDTPGLEYWNGAAWTPAGAGGSSVSGGGVIEVAYYFSIGICNVVLNETTMTINLTTELTSLTGATGSPAYTAGQLCFIHAATDPTKSGIYVLGSVASLSAVPLTRHSDWPASRKIPRGTEVYASYFPENVVNGQVNQLGQFAPGDVNTGADTIATGITEENTLIVLSSPGGGAAAPGGLSYGTYYYAVDTTPAGVISLSLTHSGTPIDITSTGTAGTGGNCATYVNVDGPFRGLSGVIRLYGNTTNQSPSEWSFSSLSGLVVVYDIFDRPADPDFASGSALGGLAEGTNSVAIGYGARTSGNYSVSVGYVANAAINGVAIGYGSSANNSVSVGFSAAGVSQSVVVGNSSDVAEGSTGIGHNLSVPALNSIVISSGSGGGGYPALNGSQSNSLSIGQGDILDGAGTLGLLFSKGTLYTTDATETAVTFGTTAYQTISQTGFWHISGYATAHDGGPSTESVVWKIDGTVSLELTAVTSDIRFTRIASTVSTLAKSLKIRASIDWHAGSSTNRLTCHVTGAAGASLRWWVYLGGVLGDTRYSGYEHLSSVVTIKTGPAKAIVTSEALAAGDIVNLHNSTGLKCRKASASLGYEAHGFVLENVSSGGTAMVFTDGENPYLTGLTVGPLFLSSTSGGATSTVYSTSGYLVQPIGYAMSATKMTFEAGTPVVV